MAVDYEKRGPISIITLNRPEALNAMDAPTYLELNSIWQDVRDDPHCRVAVLTGVGTRAFSAGADLKQRGHPLRQRQHEAMWDGPYGPRKARMLAVLKGIDVWKPIIAAVNGHAIGISACMLLGTDIRIASPNATFRLPEVTFNQLADGGAIPRLPRQIAFVHAARLLLLGETIDAQEALRIGLFNEIVSQAELMPRALALAEKLAALDPAAVQITKQAVIKGLDVGLDQAMTLEALYSEMLTAFTTPGGNAG